LLAQRPVEQSVPARIFLAGDERARALAVPLQQLCGPAGVSLAVYLLPEQTTRVVLQDLSRRVCAFGPSTTLLTAQREQELRELLEHACQSCCGQVHWLPGPTAPTERNAVRVKAAKDHPQLEKRVVAAPSALTYATWAGAVWQSLTHGTTRKKNGHQLHQLGVRNAAARR
jgi:hypothetical protein